LVRKILARAAAPDSAERIILAFFFLSGACGLIYQVVWLRILGLIFGNTTFATATVVTGFMAGLGLGALYFGRQIDRKGSPVRVYGYLQCAIAAYSFLTPLLRVLIEWIYVHYFRFFDPSYLHFSMVKFILAFLVLIFPTFLMGGTLPVLSRHFVRRGGDVARPVGLLYAWNTLGAVFGVIFTGFFALYAWGVWQTVYFSGFLNLLIGLICLKLLSQGSKQPAEIPSGPDTEQKEVPQASSPDAKADRALAEPAWKFRAFRLVLLALFAVSGAVSMVYEIAWTRVLSIVLGSSVYAFSVMLATFLTGISVGSFLLSRFSKRIPVNLPLFAILQVLTGLFVFLGLNQFDHMPFYFVKLFEWANGSVWMIEFGKSFLCAMVMFVPTLLIGALFACFIHIYHRTERLGEEIGTAYFSNTLGNIAGSFLTGFFIIPAIGIQNTLSTAAAVSVTIGVAAFILSGQRLQWKPLLAFGAVFILAVTAARNVHSWDRSVITSGVSVKPEIAAGMSKQQFIDTLSARETLYYREGVSSTVSVTRLQDNIAMAVNGKVDASTGQDAFTQYFLGHLPMMLKPDAKKVLIIGLGSGSTAAAVASYPVDLVEVAEIEKEVVPASDFFVRQNRNVLRDPRVAVRINDGRNHLLVSREIYDVIISEPSNPWMAGVANLFSLEYYEIMKEHLSPNGVVCQWLHAYSMATEDLAMIINTFARVFPDVGLWVSNYPDLLLIGINHAEPVRIPRLGSVFDRPEIRRDFLPFGIESAEGLLSNFWLGDKDLRLLSGRGRINSDNHPYLEFSAPRNLYRNTLRENYQYLRSFRTEPYPPLEGLTPPADENARFHARVALGFMAKTMYAEAQAELEKAQSIAPQDPEVLQNIGYLFYLRGMHEQAVLFLLRAQELEPGSPFVAYALGLVFRDKDQPERALFEFNRAVEMDPMHPRYLKAFADALLGAEQYDAALRVYARYVELYGSDFNVLNNMTDAVFSMDDVQNQQRMADLIIGFYPNVPSIYRRLGEGFEAKGLFAQARAVYERLIETLPENAAGYFLMARLHGRLGRGAEAKKYLQEAMDLNDELRKDPRLTALLNAS
jgi:spermidine synthase